MRTTPLALGALLLVNGAVASAQSLPALGNDRGPATQAPPPVVLKVIRKPDDTGMTASSNTPDDFQIYIEIRADGSTYSSIKGKLKKSDGAMEDVDKSGSLTPREVDALRWLSAPDRASTFPDPKKAQKTDNLAKKKKSAPPPLNERWETYMELDVGEAKRAFTDGEYPVRSAYGAFVVPNTTPEGNQMMEAALSLLTEVSQRLEGAGDGPIYRGGVGQTDYTPGLTITGDEEYRGATRAAIDRVLKSDPTLKDAIAEVANLGKSVNVAPDPHQGLDRESTDADIHASLRRSLDAIATAEAKEITREEGFTQKLHRDLAASKKAPER